MKRYWPVAEYKVFKNGEWVKDPILHTLFTTTSSDTIEDAKKILERWSNNPNYNVYDKHIDVFVGDRVIETIYID